MRRHTLIAATLALLLVGSAVAAPAGAQRIDATDDELTGAVAEATDDAPENETDNEGDNESEVEQEDENESEEPDDSTTVREFDRERDGNATVAINESTAVDAARSELSDRNATWRLTEVELDRDDAVYEVEFEAVGANLTWQADAEVDASTGTVFDFQETVQPTEDEDENERETENESEVEDEEEQEIENETEDEQESENESEVEDEDETEQENESEDEQESAESPSIALDRSEAVDAAAAELSDVDGTWTVERLELDRDDGVYEIRFALADASASGEAEVTVDGTTATVTEFEEEIEWENGDEQERAFDRRP